MRSFERSLITKQCACSTPGAIIFPPFSRLRVDRGKRFKYATCGREVFQKRRKNPSVFKNIRIRVDKALKLSSEFVVNSLYRSVPRLFYFFLDEILNNMSYVSGGLTTAKISQGFVFRITKHFGSKSCHMNNLRFFISAMVTFFVFCDKFKIQINQFEGFNFQITFLLLDWLVAVTCVVVHN